MLFNRIAKTILSVALLCFSLDGYAQQLLFKEGFTDWRIFIPGPLVSVDFGLGVDGGDGQPEFTEFLAPDTTSTRDAQSQVVGTTTVTVVPVGNTARRQARHLTMPVDSPTYTESALLRDYWFADRTVPGDTLYRTNNGLNIVVEGADVVAGRKYAVTVWSFTYSPEAVGLGISDWSANGVLVKDNYTFDPRVPPVANGDHSFTFEIEAVAGTGACGRITLCARPDAETHANVTLNALRVAEAASVVDDYSARELQRALKLISNADFPIVVSNGIPAEHAIVLGSLTTSPVIREHALALGLTADTSANPLEQLAIHTLDNNLFLAGNMPRAGLFAVYRFLQTQLGARWFWAGADGEHLPERGEYTLLPLAVNDAPAFSRRELTPIGWKSDLPTQEWLGRNLLNGGSLTASLREKMGFVNDGLGHLVQVPDESDAYFALHPEEFALIKGQRRPGWTGRSGCWSNDDFTSNVISKITAWAKRERYDILNVFPADVILRCECPECKAAELSAGSQSSRWFDYYRGLAQRVREQLPTMKFAGLAYTDYRQVPEGPDVSLDFLEYVEYAHYNRCLIHKLDDPLCPLNGIFLRELNAWRGKGVPMGIYGYEFDIFRHPSMYTPSWNMVADEMQAFQSMGVVRMKTEMDVKAPEEEPADRVTMRQRLSYYVYARLAWNPNERPDDILADWCDYVYGPAAMPLLAYHKAMAEAWDALEIHSTYYLADPAGIAKHLIKPDLVTRVEGLFAEAEDLINGLPAEEQTLRGRCLEQVGLERRLFEQWKEAHARSQSVPMIPIPKSNAFDTVPEIELTDRLDSRSFDPTTVRLYWSDDALHFRFDCDVYSTQDRLRMGETGRDVNVWYDDAIEIFFDPLDGSGCRLLALNPAGGTYDAIGRNASWNPDWSHQIEILGDRYIAEVHIPLGVLGIQARPHRETLCRLSMTRYTRPRRCSYPFRFQDLNAATTFYFSPAVVSVDFGLGVDGGDGQPGFTEFLAPDATSTREAQSQVVGATTVTVVPVGNTARRQARHSTMPVDSPTYTEGALLRDSWFADRTVPGDYLYRSDNGLDIVVEGMDIVAGRRYRVTVWSFTYNPEAVGLGISDWRANGVLVKDNYTFDPRVAPVANGDHSFTFEVEAVAGTGEAGRITISARPDEQTRAKITLNALQVIEAAVVSIDLGLGVGSSDGQPGFSEFLAPDTSSTRDAMSLVVDGTTVTIAPVGNSARRQARHFTMPVDSPAYTESALLRDYWFADRTVPGDYLYRSNNGLDIVVEGMDLVPGRDYWVEVWSFTYNPDAVGLGISDWTANGVRVKDNYAFDPSVAPVANGDHSFIFEAAAVAGVGGAGRLSISARPDEETRANIILNALQVFEKRQWPQGPTMNPVAHDLRKDPVLFLLR